MQSSRNVSTSDNWSPHLKSFISIWFQRISFVMIVFLVEISLIGATSCSQVLILVQLVFSILHWCYSVFAYSKQHLYFSWTQISRDCQELEPSIGEQLASLLYLEPDSELMVCLFHGFVRSSKHGELDQEVLEQFRKIKMRLRLKKRMMCCAVALFFLVIKCSHILKILLLIILKKFIDHLPCI